MRLGVEDVQPRARAEEREQVPRVVVVDRQLARPRVVAGQERRDAVQRPSETTLSFANHVEPCASSAKWGKRTGSTRPRASSSEFTGSSSNTIITTGARGRSPAAAYAEGVPENVSVETPELNRNSARNTSGAGARTVSKSRAASKRTESAAAAGPASAARTTS